jgi:hypothetical protein
MRASPHSSRRCSLVLVLMIAGCAGPMGTIHPVPPPPPPVTAFDGSYRSVLRSTTPTVEGQVFTWCDSQGQAVITVDQGRFTYAVPHPNVPGNPTPVFQATMAPDGTFAGDVVSGSLTGQISGQHLEGTISGAGCTYTLSASKV